MESLSVPFQKNSCWSVLSRGTVYYAVQGGSKFWVCRWNFKCLGSLLIYEQNDKLKRCVHLFTTHHTPLTFVSLMRVASPPPPLLNKENALERVKYSLPHWLDVSSSGETNKKILFRFEEMQNFQKRWQKRKQQTKDYYLVASTLKKEHYSIVF